MKTNPIVKTNARDAMEQILANTIPFCFTTYLGQDLPSFNPVIPGSPIRTKPKIPQKLVHCSRKIYKMLEESELRIFWMICNDLKHNNALWSVDGKPIDETDMQAIGSLIEKKILYPTEIASIFIVNPLAIRRGRISSIIAATTELLGKHISLNSKMIKKISPSSGYMQRLYNSEPSVSPDSTAADPFLGS